MGGRSSLAFLLILIGMYNNILNVVGQSSIGDVGCSLVVGMVVR